MGLVSPPPEEFVSIVNRFPPWFKNTSSVRFGASHILVYSFPGLEGLAFKYRVFSGTKYCIRRVGLTCLAFVLRSCFVQIYVDAFFLWNYTGTQYFRVFAVPFFISLSTSKKQLFIVAFRFLFSEFEPADGCMVAKLYYCTVL